MKEQIFSFGNGYVHFLHQVREDGQHRLWCGRSHSPWFGKEFPIGYTTTGKPERLFVAQVFTTYLPVMFELLPPDGAVLEDVVSIPRGGGG